MKTRFLATLFLACVLPGCFLHKEKLQGYRAVLLAPKELRVPFNTERTSAKGRLTSAELSAYVAQQAQTGFRTTPLDSIPLLFEKNIGQAQPSVHYIVRRLGYGIFLTDSGITTSFLSSDSFDEQVSENALKRSSKKTAAFAMSLVDAKMSSPTEEGVQPTQINIIHGSLKSALQVKELPTLLRYSDVYSGINLLIFGQGHQAHYAFEVSEKASYKTILWRFQGTTGLSIRKNGDLVIHTKNGLLFRAKPKVFEKNGKSKVQQLKARYRIIERDVVGFDVQGQTPGSSLFIDPVLVFSTYFGGSEQEGMLGIDQGANDIMHRGFQLELGADGRLYVAGATVSADLPVTDGSTLHGDADTFVLALEVTQSNTAQVAYATYLGGTGHDRARSLAPIADGRVFVAGHTNSTDFPASADAVNPPRDFGGGFIVRLDPNGVFERGTFIGRAIKHFPNGLKYEASNSTTNVPRLYVTGTVHRNAFPGGGDATNGAFQTEPAGDFDAFVGSIDSDLTHYNYFTLLGGSARDIAMDLAVSDGYVFVTGATSSENFPVTEAAAQTTRTPPSKFVDCRPHVLGHIAGPCFDAFVTRLNRAGANLIYSTYYGFGGEDFARGIALDSMKRAFITGASLNRLADAETDIFVTKFEAGGASALSETFLRAGSRDHGEAITVDDDGRAHVVGTVSVDGLATGAPVQSALAGDKDIFYARLSALGATEYFTYYGGENADRGFSVDTVASGEEGQVCVFIAGASSSENLATGAALQSALASSAPDLLLSTLCDIPFNPSNPGSFSKTSSTGVVQPGQEFSYTISLLNSTDQTAPAVSIIDAVPIELQVLSVLGPNGCSFSANNVSCTITVPPGQTSITIGVKAKSTCNLQITNTAKINVLGFTHESSTSTFIACPPAADLCGNGTRDSGEQCDDGNRGGRDGCNAACQTERCGDGDVDPGEQCDDSNQDNNDACSTSCIAQTPLGGSCGAGPGSLACPADTVCGKNCSSVNDCAFPFFLFPLIGFCPFDGDSYEVCTLPECMPPTAGVRVVG